MWVVDLIAVCYKAKLLSPVSLLLLSFSFTFSFMFGFWKRHLLEGALQAQYRPRRGVRCGLDAIYELRPRSCMVSCDLNAICEFDVLCQLQPRRFIRVAVSTLQVTSGLDAIRELRPLDALCELSLLVLYSAPRGSSPATPAPTTKT